jgi:hypothetical protein
MYEAAMDVRKTLHQQGLLSWWQWQLADAMSTVRYMRRCVLTFKRRHGGLLLTRRNA